MTDSLAAIRAAQEALQAARQHAEEAQVKVHEAAAELDASLAEAGWRRMVGAYSAHATPLYVSHRHEAHGPLAIDQVMAVVEHEALV
jgi:hypothetical protein